MSRYIGIAFLVNEEAMEREREKKRDEVSLDFPAHIHGSRFLLSLLLSLLLSYGHDAPAEGEVAGRGHVAVGGRHLRPVNLPRGSEKRRRRRRGMWDIQHNLGQVFWGAEKKKCS